MTKKSKWYWKIRAYALKNAVNYKGKARVESVISSLFHEGLKKQEVDKIIDEVRDIVKKVNKLKIEEQEKEFEELEKQVHERKERKGLPPLPNAKRGKVIMRFAPSASGPLHIGHAMLGMFSSLYVKKYGGKFYVRIEDTNPENIYEKAYHMIKDESKWLFHKPVFIIQSDRIKIYYKYAEKLIRKDKTYVCDCSQKLIQKNRKIGRECSCRHFPLKEQLERWKKMLQVGRNNYGEGKAILRFKGNMHNSNPALRDFPLARINLKKHPRQGKKYRVWPLMNLAVSVDDIEHKMTHVIRGKDHRDNAERQKLIFKALGKEKKFPWTAFIGRLNFKDFTLSTTKMKQAIEKGKYSGWDDKKLPTIASLKKQGYKPEAFAKLVTERGLSEVDKVMRKKDFFDLLKKFSN